MAKPNFDLTGFIAKGGEEKVVVQEKQRPSFLPPFLRRRQEIVITVKHEFPKTALRPVDALDVSDHRVSNVASGVTSVILSFETGANQFIVLNYLWLCPTATANVDWYIKKNGEWGPLGNRLYYIDGSLAIGTAWGADLASSNFASKLYYFLRPKEKIEFECKNSTGSPVRVDAVALGYSFIDVDMANKLR